MEQWIMIDFLNRWKEKIYKTNKIANFMNELMLVHVDESQYDL